MNTKELLRQKTADFEAVLDFYKKDIASISTGRANSTLLENIKVDYYGQFLQIKELAAISVPEPRMLVIQPWDKAATEAICGAIRKSDISINPVVDGQIIRLSIPQLTEERRKDFVKILKRKTEESKIKIRQIREQAINEIQKMEKAGEISEDERFKAKEDIQKMVDDHNNKLAESETKKESEIMS